MGTIIARSSKRKPGRLDQERLPRRKPGTQTRGWHFAPARRVSSDQVAEKQEMQKDTAG